LIEATTSTRKKGLVVFVATTPGLGNQLYGALSAALYAMVTGRAIKMSWQKFAHMPALLEPLPDGPDWASSPLAYTTGHLFEHIDGCENSLSEFQYEVDPMAGHDVVIVHSNCLFMPRLMQQRAHRQVLNALNLHAGQAFGEVFRSMFQPTQSLAEEISSYLLTAFAGAWVLGLQVRVGMLHAAFEDNDAGDAKWAGNQGLQEEELKKRELEMWNRYHKFATEQLNAHRNAKVFLATDSEHILGLARLALGDRLIYAPGGLEMHGKLDPSDTEMWTKVLLDWWLLGECDDVVMMHWSTYGATATMRTGTEPFVFCHGDFVKKRWSQVWHHNDVEACHANEKKQL